MDTSTELRIKQDEFVWKLERNLGEIEKNLQIQVIVLIGIVCMQVFAIILQIYRYCSG
jgi:hypothetical protein